ncbi:MAG: formylglycine-generating enzyme family protein [Bryobacteraceae bacterium]|nr:formylglycine-generating enzyme family protein [Bryobacteraceae bacterium]
MVVTLAAALMLALSFRTPVAPAKDVAKAPTSVATSDDDLPPLPDIEKVAAGSKADEQHTNPADGQIYVWIPPGKFTMGCSPGDNECDSDERPAHPVEITKGVWMGRTEVTQAAWKKVMGTDPSRFKGDQRPVENVSWTEASQYCAKIGGRLPTEAEWEYAARGGTAGARYGELDAIAWSFGNSNSETHAVASKQANAFGLHDMLGNVWEWVANWYGPYEGAAGKDPKGPGSGTLRTLLGGSWSSVSRGVRASVRSRKVSFVPATLSGSGVAGK